MSGTVPSLIGAIIGAICTSRPKTCASGRKRRTEHSPVRNRGRSRSTTFPHSAKKLRCVSTQPLGRPVVPLVYTMVAGSSAFVRAPRSSTAASLTSLPARPSCSTAPASICQTCSSSGSRSRTDSTAAAWPSSSTMIEVAPESLRIHCTCSAELVSYTGTVTAPAHQIAKSNRVHSYRVRDIRATRSPCATPEAMRPFAAACTSARKVVAVTSCQAPSTLRAMTATSGCCAAFRRTMSVRFPSAGTSYKAGRLNSRKTAAPHRAPAPRRCAMRRCGPWLGQVLKDLVVEILSTTGLPGRYPPVWLLRQGGPPRCSRRHTGWCLLRTVVHGFLD